MIPAELIRHVESMPNYLGNRHSKEVHNLDNKKDKCNIAQIKPEHRVRLASLEDAKRQGYDNCSHCIGQSKR